MPPSKSAQALFLGIELATDQLRASIVDESLELVGVECIDFDSDLAEFQTQGGIFTTPGDAYTTPVEMWIKGLDALLEKLARNHDLSRVKSISGAAQHALVWWKSTTVPSLSSLDPNLPLHAHFSASTFSLPNTPIAQDTASHSHALAIESLLGGPDAMAARVGTCSTPSMLSAQLLRVHESWPQEVWLRTGRVQLASAFLCSLISGKWIPMGEAEACTTGMWVHSANPNSGGQGHWDEGVLDIVGGSREEGRRVRGWLGEVDTSGGGRRAGNVSRYLVERHRFDPETIVAPFTSDFLATYLSLCPSPNDAVLSFGPMDMLLTPAQHYIPTKMYNLYPHPAQESGEKRRYIAVLCNRNADVPRALVRDMYTKSWSAFDRLVAIVPPGGSIGLDDKLFAFWHLQGDSYPNSLVKGVYRFETGIKVNEFRDLRANPRCLVESQILAFRVRWSRMIATGVLGSSPASGLNMSLVGGRRGGGGVGGVTPPPLLTRAGSSSSITSSSSTSGPSTNSNNTNASSNFATSSSNPLISTSSSGIMFSIATTLASTLNNQQFDPYDHSTLPSRILCTGAGANFPAMANLVGDVFNASVYIPLTQVDSAQIQPHRNAPAQGYPGRAALGSAFVARWVWGRETRSGLSSGMGNASLTTGGSGSGSGLALFEDEMRRLLQKRWIASGGVMLKTNVNGTPSGTTMASMNSSNSLGVGLREGGPGSGANSGASTPFGGRSGVREMVVEEDEDEDSVGLIGDSQQQQQQHHQQQQQQNLGMGLGSGVLGGGYGGYNSSSGLYADEGNLNLNSRVRTQTGSSLDSPIGSGSPSIMTPSTSYTTPDLGLGLGGLGSGSGSPFGMSLGGNNNNNNLGMGLGLGNFSGSGGGSGPNTPGPLGGQSQGQNSQQNQNTGTGPIPLTPVVALATADSEAQIGLAKVAEADLDSFLMYASIVPEYCRLEGLVVKGLV